MGNANPPGMVWFGAANNPKGKFLLTSSNTFPSSPRLLTGMSLGNDVSAMTSGTTQQKTMEYLYVYMEGVVQADPIKNYYLPVLV